MRDSSRPAGAGGRVSGADGYRDFMSMFPTGMALVTAVDLYGVPHGMTCTALASVTLCPPTLLVCLNSGSGTLAAVRARGIFAVNLLDSGGRGAAELFGSAAGDRFRRVLWEAALARPCRCWWMSRRPRSAG
jgi:flavin reductase (NADH)